MATPVLAIHPQPAKPASSKWRARCRNKALRSWVTMSAHSKSWCAWWGAATPKHARAALPSGCRSSARQNGNIGPRVDLDYWTNSPHFCTEPSAAPQGMIGTEEVEFFGEPSISLSE
jgi:hypothetical protein